MNSLRISFLSELFPDAMFIHMLRDGRAVSYSILQKLELYNTERWGPQPSTLSNSRPQSKLSRCGLQWLGIVQEIQESFERIDSWRSLTIRYEDFTSNPNKVLAEVYRYCGIDETIGATVNDGQLSDCNDKWKSKLDSNQIRELNSLLGPNLSSLGYN